MFSAASLASLNIRQSIAQIPSISVIRNPYVAPTPIVQVPPSLYVAPTPAITPVPAINNPYTLEQAALANATFDMSCYLPYLAIFVLGYFILDK